MRKSSKLIPVTLFVAISTAMSVIVGLTVHHTRIEPRNAYSAVFADVSGLKAGSDVRASGVVVGTVNDMRLHGNEVDVGFSVSKDVALTDRVTARIRWANLTGGRYLDLVAEPGGRNLAPGSTIPLDRTEPALDLDTVFGGFEPLMQALSPTEVNQLTRSIIGVTRGQGSAVNVLLGHVGSFAATLGARQALIGRTITNLASALAVIDRHRGDFSHLIGGLHRLLAGLAADRQRIGRTFGSIAGFANAVGHLLVQARPQVKGTLVQVGRVSKVINARTAYVDKMMRLLPDALSRLARSAAYGSFYNFYICGVRERFTAPNGTTVYTPWTDSEVARCQ